MLSALALLIALSTIPAAYFVASSLVKTRAWVVALTLLFGLLCLASATGMGKSLAALGIAVVFPIVAFLVLDAREGKNVLVEFLIVCGISLVGGLAVAGILNGLPYFVKAQEFRGIKVAVFAPILILAWYWAARSTNLREAMRNPVSYRRPPCRREPSSVRSLMRGTEVRATRIVPRFTPSPCRSYRA